MVAAENFTFPWGIYVGDLIEGRSKLPLFLPSQTGGLTLLYDDVSEKETSLFIENIVLELFTVLPKGSLRTEVFDFGYRKRFSQLSRLKEQYLYEIVLTLKEAEEKFYALEQILLYRHHELLTPDTASISIYNQKNATPEQYHLLLINLNHFSDVSIPPQKLRDFFATAFDAGFYTIVYGNKTLIDSPAQTAQALEKQFPQIDFQKKKPDCTAAMGKLSELLRVYRFVPLKTETDNIVTQILTLPFAKVTAVPRKETVLHQE